MKEFIKSIGDKIIIIEAKTELHPQVESLFQILSKIEGRKLVDGFSLQVGWTIYFLSKKEDGYHLFAPNYNENPFENTTEDLTVALWIQLQQSRFLRKLNLSGEAIKFSDKIVTAKNIAQVDNIYLQRSGDCEKGDSGWYIGPVNKDDDTEELEAFYAYQLLKLRPELIKALVLPFEYMAIFEKDEIKAILNENDEDIWVN